MAAYTIGDVEQLVGVKVHIIRDWEGEVPMIQPKRDKRGRCVYGERDVEMLKRLKHLLYDRHYTIQAARRQLFKEESSPCRDISIQIAELRADLLEIYERARTMGQH